MEGYIMALDAGTTSSRAIIFDKEGNIISTSQRELEQIYPNPGWVEQNPMEIWATQYSTALEALEQAGIQAHEIKAIGIANQRETTILWNKNTGRPIYNAIVWQCRRTSNITDELKSRGLEENIKQKTGLVVDAYFSGTKIKWILDNVQGARDLAENDDLLFGTVDSWILWNLTKGKAHATDYSNASRTMIYNIRDLDWDEEILGYLDIPKSILPFVKNSSDNYGHTDSSLFGGVEIPITGIAGDQQASLFGQSCFYPGMVKNTYGTGCFVLMNTGKELIDSKNGLISTIAWGLDGKITYALEGSIFNAGSAIQWLRDELKLIYDAPMSEYYANIITDTEGVYMVPAFTGLGAPYWDMYARGGIFGLARGTKREHIVRATLESLAYQSRDVIDVMKEDSHLELKSIRVNGGATTNDFLMQFQADIMDIDVERPEVIEATALGVAYLAGLNVGYWKNIEEIYEDFKLERLFSPDMDEDTRTKKYKYWKKAVERTMDWIEPEI